MRCNRSLDGTMKGHNNDNAMLDTRTYEVEFPNGCSDEYTANMYAQCDEACNQFNMIDCIVDHKTDGHALDRAYMFIKHGSNKKFRKTTKGWHLCIKWKDGSWERLADLKEINPVEAAKYDVSKNLHDAPAFIWCVQYYGMAKRSHIIADVTKRYHKMTHTFRIEVPKSCDDCIILDKENGHNLWQYSVRKEMRKVRIAFQILNGKEPVPPTYQEIRCHVIFDVKIDGFCRSARFVPGGHTTDTPHATTYESVVSRESVRISLILAALNDLDVKMADIENAYLTAPITDKIWTMLGPEFGDDAGNLALVV
jgi:hypothetical protein